MDQPIDIVIVGAGAAGLAAAISAARARPQRRIVLVDGATKLGAKILVSGGGRCNVTHERVSADDFAGGSRHTIRKVLGRFTVDDTITFFQNLGVTLKREETGKLFPITDSADTILKALLGAAREAGVEIRHPFRVEHVETRPDALVLGSPFENLSATHVVLATGGKSLPRTGSDGAGYGLARTLGHTITSRVFPALVPLLLPKGDPLTGLTGLSTAATLSVTTANGKTTATATGSLLCTHFGLSGPAALDVSRYWIDAVANDPASRILCNWLPGETPETVGEDLRSPGARTPFGRLRRRLPERLVRTVFDRTGVATETVTDQLTRAARVALAHAVTAWPLPVCGDRGWNFAEVTAGGVPLSEIDASAMRSRKCSKLYVCGEICDVDGRIGGFNFQWAWASGFVAGRAAVLSLDSGPG